MATVFILNRFERWILKILMHKAFTTSKASPREALASTYEYIREQWIDIFWDDDALTVNRDLENAFMSTQDQYALKESRTIKKEGIAEGAKQTHTVLMESVDRISSLIKETEQKETDSRGYVLYPNIK
jgi:hypothetical protein